MAQNITLLGASYSDVPAVTLPKTGGGTASFTDVTDTTAVASDVLSGKYFYKSDGSITQGSIGTGVATAPATISGTSATIGVVQQGGAPRVVFSKSISVTPSVTAGYITSGTASDCTVSLVSDASPKSAATYTPGTTNQVISSGVFLSGDQTISGDANLVAGNIKSGTSIFGVTGSYTGIDISDTTATASDVAAGKYFYTAEGVKVAGTADVVTSSGTSGIWTWRVWASGKAECWGETSSATYSSWTLWNNLIYYTSSTTGGNAYPTNFFASAPWVTMDFIATTNDAWLSHHRDGTKTNAPTAYLYKATNASAAGFIRYYAMGTVSSSWTG